MAKLKDKIDLLVDKAAYWGTSKSEEVVGEILALFPKRKSQWIPASKPPLVSIITGEVIVQYYLADSGPYVSIGRYNVCGYWIVPPYSAPTVTHWQPLPAPCRPKKK